MEAIIAILTVIAIGQQVQDAVGANTLEVKRMIEDELRRGNTKRAIELAEEALRKQIDIHGPQHLEVSKAMYGLGQTYMMDRRYDEAEKMARKGLAIAEAHRESGSEVAAHQLSLIGQTLGYNGKFRESDISLKAALNLFGEIKNKTEDSTPYTIYTTYHSLARNAFLLKSYDDCVAYGNKAIACHAKLELKLELRYNHMFLQLNDVMLGSICHLNRIGDMAPLKQNMIAVLEQPGWDQKIVAAMAWEDLAQASLLDLVDPDSGWHAEVYCTKALTIRERLQGPEHFDLLSPLERLARIELSRDDWFSAEFYLKRIIAIREKSQGPNHPDLIPSLWTLTQVYRAEKNVAGALGMGERLLSLSEANPGKGSPTTLEILDFLIELNESQGNYKRTEELKTIQSNHKNKK